MKKFIIFSLMLVLITGLVFSDYSDYQATKDSFTGERTVQILLLDTDTSGCLVTTIKVDQGIIVFSLYDEYKIFSLTGQANVMYKFDDNGINTVTTAVRDANMIIFEYNDKNLWENLKVAEKLGVRIIDPSDGGSYDYFFDLEDYQRVLRELNLL